MPTFTDTTGTVAITLNNLAFGAGRISARYDRTVTTKKRIMWRATVQYNTAPQIGETVEIYLATSDGTNEDGTIGTADAALTSDKRRNLRLLGLIVVDTVSTATDITASGAGPIITDQYYSVGVWNASSADNLQATNNVNIVVLTEVDP